MADALDVVAALTGELPPGTKVRMVEEPGGHHEVGVVIEHSKINGWPWARRFVWVRWPGYDETLGYTRERLVVVAEDE